MSVGSIPGDVKCFLDSAKRAERLARDCAALHRRVIFLPRKSNDPSYFRALQSQAKRLRGALSRSEQGIGDSSQPPKGEGAQALASIENEFLREIGGVAGSAQSIAGIAVKGGVFRWSDFGPVFQEHAQDWSLFRVHRRKFRKWRRVLEEWGRSADEVAEDDRQALSWLEYHVVSLSRRLLRRPFLLEAVWPTDWQIVNWEVMVFGGWARDLRGLSSQRTGGAKDAFDLLLRTCDLTAETWGLRGVWLDGQRYFPGTQLVGEYRSIVDQLEEAVKLRGRGG